MSGFDCYCALCGGPFVRIRYSGAPVDGDGDGDGGDGGEEVEMQDGNDSDQSMVSDDGDDEFEDEDDDEEEENNEDDDDNESNASNAIVEGAYDPDVLTKADVAWTKRLIVLGFNPLAKGASK